MQEFSLPISTERLFSEHIDADQGLGNQYLISGIPV
jgi:hypothetical protein